MVTVKVVMVIVMVTVIVMVMEIDGGVGDGDGDGGEWKTLEATPTKTLEKLRQVHFSFLEFGWVITVSRKV